MHNSSVAALFGMIFIDEIEQELTIVISCLLNYWIKYQICNHADIRENSTLACGIA